MGILRGVLIGVLLCAFGLILFITILGGLGAVGVQSAGSDIEGQVDEQLVGTGASPAMRRMVNGNVRTMNDALVSGPQPSAAEVEAAREHRRAARERVSFYWRARREAREAARRRGSPAPQVGSAEPTP
ncbi:MAG TPA: hypothetical protein VEX35_15640 [Allosphingosinicella sp.]|nr:hypothetical protein [Allosphingosinicella sp.]